MTVTAIPRAKGRPLLGNFPEFRSDPLAFFTELSRQHEKIAQFSLGPQSFYIVFDLDMIREILVTKGAVMHRVERIAGILKKTMGDSLLTTDGDWWRQQRKLIQPAFHHQQIASYAETMVKHALAATQLWQDGAVRDLEKDMDRMTLAIVTAALFNDDGASKADLIADGIKMLQELGTKQMAAIIELPKWIPTPLRQQQKTGSTALRSAILEVIRARRDSGERKPDLLSMLIEAKDEDTGQGMDDETICSEVLTLYLAGYDTTALSLSFTWYELARNPEIEAKFHAEIDRVLEGRLPTLSDLPKLEYTKLIFNETLRMYPPTWFNARQATEAVEIGGYHFQKGDVLFMSPFVTHRDPRWWGDGDVYRPERFAHNAADGWHKFQYMPFGGGNHICIGNQFALMEGPLAMATIGQRFRFELTTPDQQVELEPQITMGPKGGMPLRIKRRG